MSDAERLWAVRGAVQADKNDVEAILTATEALMRELMSRNVTDTILNVTGY